MQARAEKRDEYISRVLTENKARGFSQGRNFELLFQTNSEIGKSDVMLHTDSKRTQSVKGIYVNNSASKPKGSNLIRLHTDKSTTHNDSVETISAQKTRITLPELGDSRQGYTLYWLNHLRD